MKETIKQLEKEIEISKERFEKLIKVLGDFNSLQLKVLDRERKKAKLQTLQEVCKEIEEFDINKELKDYDGEMTEFVRVGMKLSESKLLKKFQGEEE